MRPILFAVFLPVASLLAQEAKPQTLPAPPAEKPADKPADKPAAKPAEPAAPANEIKEISGSVSGDANAEPAPKRRPPVSDTKAVPYPRQYLLLVAEAMKSFKARDFPSAIAYADKADVLVPPTVWTVNVRGAVAIEQLDFMEGKRLCVEALKMDPEFMPAKFNLCEIPFLQKNYAAARLGWMSLYKNTAKEDPTTELLVYRIFLTYLLEKDQTQAKEWLDKIPFPSQTPAYQYGNAAWEHEYGTPEKFTGWMQSAEFIWPQVKRADFIDVLIQLKWASK